MDAEMVARIEYSIKFHADNLIRAIERYLLVEALCDRLAPSEIDVDRAIALCLNRSL